MNHTHNHTNDRGLKNNKITNSIKGLDVGPIRDRLIYVYYMVIGLFFFVIGTYTAFNIFTVWFKYGALGEVNSFRFALFFCYVYLNLMISYGFIFCRKWLLPVFGFNFIVLLVTYLIRLDFARISTQGFEPSRQFIGLLITGFIFLTILFTKRHLQGVLWRKIVIFSFAFVLLLSLFIINSNLVY